MGKPSYCVFTEVTQCAECSLSSYGKDCNNNPIADDNDYEPSQWDLADKHGITPGALSSIRELLPEWVFDLPAEKISELILAMHRDHQRGRECEARDAKEFLGCPWWGAEKKPVTHTDNPMDIINLWVVANLPGKIIAEISPGVFKAFDAVPYRVITPETLEDYTGETPRRISGVVLPKLVYTYYGLRKKDEALTETARVRITHEQKEAFKAAAVSKGMSETDFLRKIFLENI